MTQEKADIRWMRRALQLARRGFTPPNPMVGCVIVRDGQIVGEGFHPIAGEPHAEVFALRSAGIAAKGATAYVTLEPCCHFGRTPPCTSALIDAGVSRVVAACEDVDLRVAGKGVQTLRSAGIEVVTGVLAEQAEAINTAFFHYHRTGMPYTTLKAAITLDGKIATSTGSSRWITGPSARRHVHTLRARSGAVLTGIGTLLADDAELTARLRPESPRQPLRVVVDSTLRTPPDCRAVKASSIHAPLLIATTHRASVHSEERLLRPGVEVLRLDAENGDPGSTRVNLRGLFDELAKRQIISVLAEGGGTLNSALLEAGIVNRVLFFVAPVLAGGIDAPTAVEGEGVRQMADAMRTGTMQVRRFGEDIAIEASITTSLRTGAI